jgi:8-oxo-dGTP pyrophosphatase MutT (NUDIX family)
MEFKDFFQTIIESDENMPWVHYSKVPYLKFNPKQFHRDPAGYYFFPKEFKPAEMWLGYPYKFRMRLKPHANILDFSKMSMDTVWHIAKAAKVDARLKKHIEEYPKSTPVDLMHSLWSDFLRNETFVLEPSKFNAFLRKQLGYDAIFDNQGVIHSREQQLIVLNPKAIDKVVGEQVKFNGFGHFMKVVEEIKRICQDYGPVEVDKPQKRNHWGHKALVCNVEVKRSNDNYALFVISQDDQANLSKRINVHMSLSRPSLSYGVGANYSIANGEFDGDYERSLRHSLDQIFAKPVKENVEDDIEKQRGDSDHQVSHGEDGRFWGDRGAGVIIQCTKTKRYLIGLRSQYVNEPNTWGTFGGMIDEGEDPKEAVLRELDEEVGIPEKINIELFDIFESGKFKFYNFYGQVQDEFKPQLNWENSDARWFAVGDFPKNLHFGLKRLVQKLPQ